VPFPLSAIVNAVQLGMFSVTLAAKAGPEPGTNSNELAPASASMPDMARLRSFISASLGRTTS
jgi:hypothetical protein